MKIFVGHSFDDKDSEVVDKFVKFFKSREDIEVITGERAQNKSVAQKVKDRISESDVFAGIFTCNKKMGTGKGIFSREKVYTTSNWVIQESGFALGRDKPNILIVENDIDKFPELQGDLELVYFNRNKLEQPFIQINEIIDSMFAREKGTTSHLVHEELQPPEGKEEEEEDKRETPVAIDEDAFHQYWAATMTAMDTKNPAAVRKVYETHIVPTPSLDEDQKLVWKGVTLRFAHSIGDSDAFRELVELAETNKDKPKVVIQLAHRLKHMGEHDKAKDKYLEVKDLYDIKNEGDKTSIVDCCIEAYKCVALQGKYNEAIVSLSQLLLEDDLKGQRAQLLRGLADISKDNEDMERFFIYAEGCLGIDPTATNLRFNLAFHYAEKGQNKLSLLHGRKLTDTVEHPMGLNNLGIQYERVDLKGKSITRLYQAADRNLTLAMANLARIYLKQGFVEDARRMIKRANDLSKDGIEVHGNIGYFTNQLDSLVSEEDKKERALLIDAEKEREFRVKYGGSYLCGTIVLRSNLEGIWETPWGNLEMSFDEDDHTIKAEQRTELSSIKHRLVSLEGTIMNLSGNYDIKVIDTTEWSSGPSKDNVYLATGYMVMRTENNRIIDIMEKSKEDKMSLLSWRKIVN
ncbi:hypothetical protein ACFLVO_01220 [Chloroflexota bacterium]